MPENDLVLQTMQGKDNFLFTFLACGFFFCSFVKGQTTTVTPTISSESSLSLDVNLDGDTVDDVYLISTLGELLWIQEQIQNEDPVNWSIGKIFLQTADIDASPTKFWDDSDDDTDGNSYNDPNDSNSNGNNEGWYPIAFELSRNFHGFYNGDYHRIISLHINRNTTNDIGFISKMDVPDSGAGIVRLGFVNGSYTIGGDSKNIGGVVAKYWSRAGNKFSEVFFEGQITNQGSATYVGGLIGYYYASITDSPVTNSYANVNFIGAGSKIGGLFGRQSSGSSKNVYARGTFDPNGDINFDFGGLVGNAVDNTFDYKLEYGYSAFEINNVVTDDKAYTIVGDDDNGGHAGYFTNLYHDITLSDAGWNDG